MTVISSCTTLLCSLLVLIAFHSLLTDALSTEYIQCVHVLRVIAQRNHKRKKRRTLKIGFRFSEVLPHKAPILSI